MKAITTVPRMSHIGLMERARFRKQRKRYVFKSELLTNAVRFWVANPDYNYGYLFALRDGTAPVVFSSKEATDESLRPMLTIRYQTTSNSE